MRFQKCLKSCIIQMSKLLNPPMYMSGEPVITFIKVSGVRWRVVLQLLCETMTSGGQDYLRVVEKKSNMYLP